MGHQIKLPIYKWILFSPNFYQYFSVENLIGPKMLFFSQSKKSYRVIFVKQIGENMIRKFEIWSDELVIGIYVQRRHYLIFFSSKCKDSDSENPDVICNGRGKFRQYRLPSFLSGSIFLASKSTIFYFWINRKRAQLSKWAFY